MKVKTDKGSGEMNEQQTIKIGLLGLGTVGSGVYKIIERQKEEMVKKTGARLEIAGILVHNLNKVRDGVDTSLLTDRWEDIINNDEISIVIEVMGGIEPAKTMILEALNSGKNVVTANKDLVAEYGRELLDAAENNGVDFLFEAAVAGGIPIIRPLKQCLAANEMDEVIGIVNGTTNYILTKMFEEGMDFDEALAKATELGYAEADPTADIEGLDAGRKVAIMASIAFHSRVTFSDVYTEGITKISARDINYAKEFGNVIKLLGVAHNTEDGIEVSVHPMMIPQEHPLASVRDSFNAVFVHGDAVDDVMFYGRGAGEFPTASAIMGDVIDVVRDIQYHCTGRISCTCYRETKVKEFREVKNKFFQGIVNKYAASPNLSAFARKCVDIAMRGATPIYDWDYVTGTRRVVLDTYDGGFYGSNEFREQHHKMFEGKLHKGETVYYEVVGFTTDGAPIMSSVPNKRTADKEFIKQYGETTVFSYGCSPTVLVCDDTDGRNQKVVGQSDIYVYRMTMTNEDGDVVEYTPDFMRYRCEQMGVKTVPVFWRGIIPEIENDEALPRDMWETPGSFIKGVAEQFYDGPDPVGKTHVREGVVCRIVNRPKFCAYKHKNFMFKVLSGIASAQAEENGLTENMDEDMLAEM